MRAVPPADAARARASRRTQLAIYLFAVSPYLVNGWINPHLGDAPVLYWLLEVVFWVGIPGVALFLARKYTALDVAALGFSLELRGRRSVPGLAVACALVSLLMVGLYQLADHYAGVLFGVDETFAYESVMPDSRGARVLVALYLGLTAGFVEETLYRGYACKLAACFARPQLLYLGAGPVVFAVVHWEGGWASVAAAYVMGVVTALVYLLLRNLWPLIVGHCVTDYFWFE